MAKRVYQDAYLIVVCDSETHEIKSAHVWSSPEWIQSRCIPGVRVYVAYAVRQPTFQDGIYMIDTEVSRPSSRYHYLREYLNLEM
jgi:hypothetical protein